MDEHYNLHTRRAHKKKSRKREEKEERKKKERDEGRVEKGEKKEGKEKETSGGSFHFCARTFDIFQGRLFASKGSTERPVAANGENVGRSLLVPLLHVQPITQRRRRN